MVQGAVIAFMISPTTFKEKLNTMHHSDISERVGTVSASIGAWITAYMNSDVIINEILRLFSSCMIAGLGAVIGYYVTKYLRQRDEWKSK